MKEELRSDFVCFRCDRIIKAGDKMLSITGSLETPEQDGSITCIENYSISMLCIPCAAILLTEAVVKKELTLPEREGILTHLKEVD